ncbi:hypothetical protein IHE55_12235 [Streptomyces pactum]|uniref:DUF1990 domain-containing protein n=1 Tax=Streptomyces pactum TaxID=68249 RepID=A0ABS0NK01_9ACTN|nr:hypothetical protein [Streptomyces pactum]MBH5335525.1 hypothetical protein [Streptomyces pactum]
MFVQELLPRHHGQELHRIRIEGTAESVLKAAREVTWREVPNSRRLLGVKKDLLDTEVLPEICRQIGFQELRADERELTFGTVLSLPFGKPVPLDPGKPPLEAFRAFDTKGHVRIAWNFHYADGELITHTRTAATSGGTGALFRLYWLFVRLPSGYTRKEWLRAIKKRHEQERHAS